MAVQAFDRVRRFAELLYEEKISDEWDAVIPVIGDEGVGKSTFILGFVWNWKQIRGREPTVENVLGTIVWDDRQEFQTALVDYPQQGVIPVMDASRVLFSKEAMDREQVEVEKDLLDMRIGERVLLLGYQAWDDMPPILRRRRAKYAFRIPTRGTVRGYNRSSLDQVYNSSDNSWPEADLTDRFPSLEGTDLWEEFQRRDEQHKRERMLPDDDDGDGDVTPEEVFEEIEQTGVEPYLREHPTNGTISIDEDLIRFDFDLSIRDARAVKKALTREVDLEEYRDEAAAPG